MEVRCDKAIYVKAKLVEASCATLRLTRIDEIRNFYYRSILFYKAQDDLVKELVKCEEHKSRNVQQSDDSATLQEWDDIATPQLRAVRRGLEAFVEFYPWVAGRLQVVKHIHTSNDGDEEQEYMQVRIDEDGGPGVQLVGASVNCPLQSLGDLSDPNPTFEPLYATVDEKAPYHLRPLVALQVSRFECGGCCVSITSSHTLFDGIGTSIFLQNVASCARGRGLCIPPDVAPRELRISARNPPSPNSPCSLNAIHKKDLECLTAKETSFLVQLVAKRFAFTEHDLARLRAHALSRQEDCKRGFKACSRFQVLTAHIWKAKARCLMALNEEDPSHEFPLFIPVNARERIVASIPKNYMGNALVGARPFASVRELCEKSLAFAVEAIQDAIEQVQSPERFQSDIDHLELLGGNACMLRTIMSAPYLSNLGFYDVDFGWGKPHYFGCFFQLARNRVIIMDANSQATSLNVFTTFISQDELLIFQDALKSAYPT